MHHVQKTGSFKNYLRHFKGLYEETFYLIFFDKKFGKS